MILFLAHHVFFFQKSHFRTMKIFPILFDEAMLASVSAVYVWLFYYLVDELLNQHIYTSSTQSQLNKGTVEPANPRTAGQNKWAISQQIDK